MILQRSHQAIQIIHRVKLQWNTFILYTLVTNEKKITSDKCNFIIKKRPDKDSKSSSKFIY